MMGQILTDLRGAGFRRLLLTLIFFTQVFLLQAQGPRPLSVSTCPSVTRRSNGNGGAALAAGDFRPTFTQNNPVALNVVGTPYQKVPYNPLSKTGNITFEWLSATTPENLPVISRVWVTSPQGVTSVSGAKFGPPPPPLLVAPGKYHVNYAFYRQNLPTIGRVTFEFTDPITGLAAFTCSSDISKNKPVPKVPVPCIPTLISSPAWVAIPCGQNSSATFTSSATGAAPIVWQKSVDKGASWSDLTVAGDYATSLASGVTTLVVSNSLSHDGEWYRVVYTGLSGCGAVQSQPAGLVSKPYPTMAVPVQNFICGVGPISVPIALTGTAPWTITYRKTTPGNPTGQLFTITTTQNPYYLKETPSSQTTYTLVSVSDQFCTAPTPTSNNVYTVYPTPGITLGTTALTVCNSASSAQLPYSGTAESPDKYSISAGTRALSGFVPVLNAALPSSPITIAFPANSTAGTYDFNLTVTNSSSTCTSNVYPFTITIQPPPVITATASVGSVCPGGTVSLTAAPLFTSYAWRIKNNSTVISTSATASFTVNTTTTYEVTGTDAIGCIATAEITVTALPVPVLTAVASPSSICAGGSTLLSVTGAATYVWSPSTGLSSSTGASVIATPSATTTYTVTGSSSGGCISTAQVTVTVNTPAVTVTGAGSICAGSIQTLSATGGTSYLWYPSSSLYSDAAATTLIVPNQSYSTVYAKPSSTTTYSVYATTSSGCPLTKTATVTVTPSPINTASSTSPQVIFCSKALPLNANFPLTVVTNSNATFAYAHSADGITYTTFATTATSGSVSASAASTATSATITLAGINNSLPSVFNYFRFTITSNSCTYTYVIRVFDTNGGSTNLIPVLNGPGIICQGSSFSISTGTLSSATNYGIKWQSSPDNVTFTDIASATSSTLTATPSATTYYRFVLSNSTAQCGTVTSSSLLITVAPAITGNTIALSNTCSDGITPQTIDGAAVSGAAYQWESSADGVNYNGIAGALQEDYSIPNNLVAQTTYFRRKASVGGCNDVASNIILVYAPLTNNIVTTATSTYCGTAPSITLSGTTPSGGSGTYTYQWQSSSDGITFTDIASATSPSLTTVSTSQTTYYRRKVTSGSCTNLDGQIMIRVNANPVVSLSPATASVCSEVSSNLVASGALNYTWSPSTGLNATTGYTVLATPLANTTYTVTGTDINGCSDSKSTVITVTTSPTTPAPSSAQIICSGNTVDLGSTISSQPVEWYFAPEQNSSYLVANPAAISTAGIYYAFAKTGNCYSAGYATFTLSVTDVSKPAVQGTSLNSCSLIDLTVVQPTVPDGVTYEWHTVASNPSAGTKITDPTSVNTGTYYLYAYAGLAACYGPASDAVTATVTTVPPSTVSSTSVSLCDPETTDLTALNNNANSTEYQWYTQTSPDPSALVAFPQAVGVAGDYYLIPVINGCVGTASPAVVVSVNSIPVVSVTSPDILCDPTVGVALTASISNTVTNPVYQWQSAADGVNWVNVPSGGVYSGVSTATLSISDATGLDGMQYRCVVTAEGCTGNTASAILVIEPTPVFTTSPVDRTVQFGNGTTFVSALNNDQTSSLQWQVSYDNGTTFNDLSEASPYSGVNTDTLTLSTTTAAMSGYVYRLKVSNLCTDYYAGATLTVLYNPAWVVTKTVTPTTYSAAGQTLNYQITIENTGDVYISPVTLSDPLADSPGTVRGTDATGDNDALLEPGETWSYTAVHTVTSGDLSSGQVANTATASGTPAAGTLADQSSTATACAIPVISGTLTACVGSALTLTSAISPAASTPWVSSNTAVASVNSSGVVSAVSAGTAVITYTTLYGCSNTVTVTITALPTLPVATIIQPTCTVATGSVTVTSPLATGMEYSLDGLTYSSSTTFSGLNAGTYSLTAKNSAGCISSAATVVVNPQPPTPDVPTITSSATVVCAGTDITLSVTNPEATQTYQWYRNSVVLAGATSQTYLANQSGSYTLKTFNSFGCESVSAAESLTVNPVPDVVITQGSLLALDCGTSSITLSSTVTLTPSEQVTYSWSLDGTAIPSTDSPTLSVSTAGVYQVTVTTASGCIGLSNSVTIVQVPSISVSSLVSEICQGDALLLSAGTNGDWLFNTVNDLNTATVLTTSASSWNANQQGYYWFQDTNGTSCPFDLLVNPLPVVSITPADPVEICSGSNVTLTAVASGTGTLNYQWERGGTIISGATASTYSVTTGDTYSIQVTDSKGCQASASRSVMVNPLPVLVITNPSAVCEPSTVDLTASAVTAGSSSSATFGYYSDAAASIALSSPAAVTASGTYYIKATLGSCSVIKPVSVTVNPLPVFTVTNPAAVCEPATVDLTSAPATASAVTFTYWVDASAVSSLTSPGSVAASGTYYIKGTTAQGCSTITPVVATVNPKPTVTGDLDICKNANTQLTGNGTPASSLAWQSLSTSVATVDPLTGLVTGVAAGQATIVYTNSNGCTRNVTITVNNLPVITGSTSICIGGITNLTSTSAPASTAWSSSNPFVASVNGTGQVTGVAPGTVTITYTDINGCQSTTSFSVYADPTITGTLSACVNSTTQLTGSGTPATSNTWASSNTSVATVDNTGLVTGIAAGTATITYTNSNGCQITATVTINALPTITGTLSACVNGTTQLTGSGTQLTSSAWASSNTSVATVDNTGLVTGVAGGTATITYTNSNGCQITTTVTINVLPTISGTLTACVNGTTQLAGSGTPAQGNAWSTSNSSVATVSTSGLVTGLAAGTATITYTNSNGCQTSAIVTINAPPTITGTLSACVTGNAQLIGSGTPATSNAWATANPTVATVSTSGLVTGVAAGTTAITYTNSSGCQTSATVIINALPTITGTLSACVNSTTQLTGSGTQATNSAWASSNSSVATVDNTGLVTGVAGGTATITYTNSSGCQITASVTINAPPTITGILSACVNSTTQLAGSGNPATGNAWSTSNSSVATVSTSGLVTGLAAGTATITYTNSNGCQTSATITISTLPTITGTLSVCVTGVTQLTGSAAASTNTAWSTSNASVATVSASGLVTGVAAGTATITFTNSNGCQTTASVTVNALPTITGILSACVAGTTQLTGSGAAATSNAWSSSNASVAIVDNNGLVTGIAAGTATITYTNSNGCSATTNVTVQALPTISGLAEVCAGSTITLTGSGTPAGSNAWISSNTTLATINNFGVVIGLAAGTVSFTYTNSTGCQQSKSVTVNPLPTQPSVISGPATVDANTSSTYSVVSVTGVASYQWTLPAGWSGTSTTNTISATAGSLGGQISVKAVSSAGCISTASNLTVIVNEFIIDANDNDFRENVIVSSLGGIVGNIYLNDLLNDNVITGTLISKVTSTILDNAGINGLTIDPEGNLIVPPGVPSGLYEITYQICETANPNNCDTAVITIQINSEPIVVPEGISPQGDGRNDKWRIRGLTNYPKHEVMVYNRWGNMVFRASPYNNDWDGKSSNSLTISGESRVPAGTYYWVINLGNGETLAGYLYIIY